MSDSRWYFDTSALVPAVVASHPHHALAVARLQALRRDGHEGYTSAHSLAEFYSVLTRAPFKPPLSPAEVWRLIDEVLLPSLHLITLTAKEYAEVTRHCALAGWTGGRIHDAIHLRCAQKAHCDWIYTFNVKDFRALSPPDLLARITAP